MKSTRSGKTYFDGCFQVIGFFVVLIVAMIAAYALVFSIVNGQDFGPLFVETACRMIAPACGW